MSFDIGSDRLQVQVIHYPKEPPFDTGDRSMVVVYLLTASKPTIKEQLALQAYLDAIKGIQALRIKPRKKASRAKRP